jgi:hypothetical protein
LCSRNAYKLSGQKSKYVRGDKARAGMRAKGYVQAQELIEKLSSELGRTITLSALRNARGRGRIKGKFHKESNLWFFPLDTKWPNPIRRKGTKLKETKGRAMNESSEEPALLGPWANWQAPGFVKMAGRNYQVWGAPSRGWLGVSDELY